MRRRTLLAATALFMLAGCGGGNKFIGRPGLEVIQATQGGVMPPPSGRDLIEQQRSYLVGPFDRLAIDVYGVPDLSRTIQVDASGQISLPLVGTVRVAGLAPTAVADLIAGRLRGRYVRSPQVTVNADTVNQMMTVDGEVRDPGLFPVTGRMTLMRAIASAKGTTEFADTNYVVVFRRVGDRQMAALHDLRAVRQGIYADPEIYANDVVYVGDSQARRLFQSVVQSSALLTAPLIALLN